MSETEVSEKIENKSTNEQSTTERSIKFVSRKSERTQVNIVDFNLLQIPPKIDINFIIQDIIVPRLPDGYTIALSEPNARSNANVFSSAGLQMMKMDSSHSESSNNFLIPTNSPRQLHPKRTLKFDVNVIESMPTERNTNGKSDRVYLFSQLLQDLDDLFENQQPLIEKQMDEILENLSVSAHDEHDSDQQDAETDDSPFKGIIFIPNLIPFE